MFPNIVGESASFISSFHRFCIFHDSDHIKCQLVRSENGVRPFFCLPTGIRSSTSKTTSPKLIVTRETSRMFLRIICPFEAGIQPWVWKTIPKVCMIITEKHLMVSDMLVYVLREIISIQCKWSGSGTMLTY